MCQFSNQLISSLSSSGRLSQQKVFILNTKLCLMSTEGHERLPMMSELSQRMRKNKNDTRCSDRRSLFTVKILKVRTPQTIAILVLKLVKFHVTLH